MIFRHRANTSENLKKISKDFGVEIDLRSWGKDIILSHDPFTPGEKFVDWLKDYSHQGLILNVKEDGLAPLIIKILEENGIENYLFLDSTYPTIIKFVKSGFNKFFIRYSEYETIKNIEKLKGSSKWVWVDSFEGFSLEINDYKKLKVLGFKICLVSPELAHKDLKEIQRFKAKIFENSLKIDAICTKFPHMWSNLFAEKENKYAFH